MISGTAAKKHLREFNKQIRQTLIKDINGMDKKDAIKKFEILFEKKDGYYQPKAALNKMLKGKQWNLQKFEALMVKPKKAVVKKAEPKKEPVKKKPEPKKPELKQKPKSKDEILDDFFDTLDLSPLGQLKTNMQVLVSDFDAKTIKKQGISEGNKKEFGGVVKQYKDYADKYNNLIDKIKEQIPKLTNVEKKSFFENNKQLKKDFDEVTKNFKKRYNAHKKILVKKVISYENKKKK
jgi:hypothetical protein